MSHSALDQPVTLDGEWAFDWEDSIDTSRVMLERTEVLIGQSLDRDWDGIWQG